MAWKPVNVNFKGNELGAYQDGDEFTIQFHPDFTLDAEFEVDGASFIAKRVANVANRNEVNYVTGEPVAKKQPKEAKPEKDG